MKNRFYLLALLALCAVMLFSCSKPSASAGEREYVDKVFGSYRLYETDDYPTSPTSYGDVDLDDDYYEERYPNRFLLNFDYMLRGTCTEVRHFVATYSGMDMGDDEYVPEERYFVLYTFKISEQYIGDKIESDTIKLYCQYYGRNNARYHVSMEEGKEYIIFPYCSKDWVDGLGMSSRTYERDKCAFINEIFKTYYSVYMTSCIMPIIDGDVHLLGGIVADYEALGDEPEEHWIENKIGGYPIRRLAVDADKFAAYYTKFYNESPEEYKQNPLIHYEYRDPEGKWVDKLLNLQ